MESFRPYPGKRLLDIALLLATAPLAIAVGLVCAAAIRVTSAGPVFYVQERIGRYGAPFSMFKFRTMIHAADNPLIPDPSRITSAGRWLRRLSLDELPQLINVARGEMSIVGPRPALGHQVAQFDSRQLFRLQAAPGITGLAQVRGRNELPWTSRIELDLEYLERQSLRLDLAILAASVRAIASGRGVTGHPTDDPIASPPG